MKVYISGQISGLPYNLAYNKFRDAEIAVNEWAEAVNPMQLDVMSKDNSPQWVDYMLTDLDVLMRECEGIYMLRDWRQSKGARIEHAIAEIMGMAIYYETLR